jgi:toxin YoeB
MEFLFKETAEKDLTYWHRNNKSIIKKIESLLKAIKENPFGGIGKPEALKNNLSGYWSRRIDREHRIIYKVDEEKEQITIYSLRGHYEKNKKISRLSV